MTTEELLKSRYKVIADYPNCHFNVGQIIEKRKYMNGKWYVPGCTFDPDDYKANFQKLEWWQERKPEEMPRYLKDKDGNKVYSVYKHFNCTYPQSIRTGESDFFDDPNCWLREHDYTQNYSFYLPATEEEFNQYQSSIKHL